MPRPALQGGSGAQYSPLCPETIWSSIESLYDDELKPYGRILRKRISERATGCSGVDVDMRRLRAACEALDGVVVVSEGGGDWSALLRGREERFADVYSPEDPYTRELWSEAAAYFESLQDPEMTLPGGRYSCAQALIARNLPFLSGRSLGQVCHIVQLAISQKKAPWLPQRHSSALQPLAVDGERTLRRAATAMHECRQRHHNHGDMGRGSPMSQGDPRLCIFLAAKLRPPVERETSLQVSVPRGAQRNSPWAREALRATPGSQAQGLVRSAAAGARLRGGASQSGKLTQIAEAQSQACR